MSELRKEIGFIPKELIKKELNADIPHIKELKKNTLE